MKKDICLRCKTKIALEYDKSDMFSNQVKKALTDYQLDTKWYCPVIKAMLLETEQTPIQCPFLLEHLVSDDAGLWDLPQV